MQNLGKTCLVYHDLYHCIINCFNSNLPMSLSAFVYLNSAEMHQSLSILNNWLANFAVSN